MRIIKFIAIALIALFSFVCYAQETEGEFPDLCEWTQARIANAKAGRPEQVKMVISSTLGWGCDCPPFVIGDMGFAPCESMFLNLVSEGRRVKIPARGDYLYKGDKRIHPDIDIERYLVTGHYTGKVERYKSSDEPDKPKAPVTYGMQEFLVVTIKALGKKGVTPPVAVLSNHP